MNTYKQGDRVHLDIDNPEWGRVSSDGTILMCMPQHNVCLVSVDNIRADIIVYNDALRKLTE